MIKTMIVVSLLLFSIAGSGASVPKDALPPDFHVCEYHLIKLAMSEHDKGNSARWVTETISDGEIHLTNSGRPTNDHAQLRAYLEKIERMYPGHV